MKPFVLFLFRLLLGMLVFLPFLIGVQSIQAQSPTADESVRLTPTNLTITGTRDSQQTRTLLLETTQPITDIDIVPLDLERADQTTVLPAAAIQVTLPTDQVPANGYLTIPITVSLKDVPSGEFAGSLLLKYAGGTETLPITVRVKDHWYLPLGVLVVGIVLGLLLAIYQARGRPHDLSLVRMGRLEAIVKAEKSDLPDAFVDRFEFYWQQLHAALQNARWDEAQQIVTSAETLWDKWRRTRPGWLAQLKFAKALQSQLDKDNRNHSSHYLNLLSRDLNNALLTTPDLTGPDQLRERLVLLSNQKNHYHQVVVLLEDMQRFYSLLTEDTRQNEWKQKYEQFQRRLKNLVPSEQNDLNQLHAEVREEVTNLLEEVKTKPAPAAKGPSTVVALSQPDRLSSPGDIFREARNAANNLEFITWLIYGIAALLLIGIGFNELYHNQPAFGTWYDYFKLFAWGLGSGTTRAAVGNLVQGWGESGLTPSAEA